MPQEVPGPPESCGVASSRPSRTRRRADIEGLRIVAVLLVVVYHYAQAGVSGGVDVFLFISGYFVLGGLARRAEQGEALGVAAFYRRTARRLVPLAWFVCAAVGVAALSVAGRGDMATFGRDFTASAAYVENWWLDLSGTEYGATSTYLNPFQHFWSLSVQAQVFLVAPWLLLTVAAAWRRLRPRDASSMVVPVALVTVIAIGGSWWLVALDQRAAYFSTVARAWEFLAGALLALAARQLLIPGWLRVLLGWAGLVVLCLAGLFVDGTTQFPGPRALVPLVAAAAIILAGTEPTRYGVDRLLGARPLASAGRYSYALYLWHWPVMSVWLLATRESRLGITGALVAASVSVVLSIATHHLLEQPLRQSWRARPARWRAVGVVTAVVVAVATVGVGRGTKQDIDWERSITTLAANAELTDYPGMMSVVDPEAYPVPAGKPAIPVPGKKAEEEATEEATEDGCPVIGDHLWCLWDHRTEYGAATGDVVLLGSSHSAAWHAPVHMVADQLGWTVTTYIRGGCPFAFGDDLAEFVTGEAALRNCERWNGLVLEELREDPPDLVVTTYSRPFAPDGSAEWVPESYVGGWEALQELGTDVIAVRANAGLPSADFVCPTDDRCVFPRERLYGDDAEILGVEVPGNVHVLDVTPYACVDGDCPSVIGNVRVYADQVHLTYEYGRTASPLFYDFVTDVLAGRR
ncbi:acyltransferase [Cellulomonas sp. C5510]|nr:acyltransferase family protein [Cellulomonas sp. C5510]QZN84774.1 acyltransferase [Cellulomonas sp. C5510]